MWSGSSVIVRTGAQTFFGQLADEIVGRHIPTAFDKGINRFTLLMIRFIVVMGPLVFLINGLTKHDWLEALLFAVAVAVGLTPEMLPMIVTVNLAKGATAMARAKVNVKRLNAVLEHVDLHKILGIDNDYKKIDEIPFDFSRRTASTTVRRSRPPMSAFRSIRRSISPRNLPTSSCSRRASW
jgi:magnesium-transporting ATPase (P-type)